MSNSDWRPGRISTEYRTNWDRIFAFTLTPPPSDSILDDNQSPKGDQSNDHAFAGDNPSRGV